MKAVKEEEKKTSKKGQPKKKKKKNYQNSMSKNLDAKARENRSVTDKSAKKVDEATGKKKNEKNKFEKRMEKTKKENDLLNLHGIPKFYTTYLVELLYIFLLETLVKILIGNLAFDWTLLRILLSSALLSLLISALSDHLPLIIRRTVLITFNFAIAFYAWIQLGLINYVGSFMSLGNAEQGTKIVDYIVEFLRSYTFAIHTIYIPFILFILYIVFERNITKDGFEKNYDFKNVLSDAAVLVYASLLASCYYTTLKVDFMQNKFQTISNIDLFKYPSNPSMAIKNFGSTVYFILDIKSTIMGNAQNLEPFIPGEIVDDDPITDNSRKIDDEAWESIVAQESDPSLATLNSYFINKKIVPKNDYTGMFEGKNLIMIMLESVGYAVFSEEYKEYFPTLYKLYSEGISSINNYSPRNNCATGESEMASQISVYSIETTCTVNTYKNNNYRGMALLSLFGYNGYETSTYHDYTDLYYSRSIYEYNFGSMKYYGIKDLDIHYEIPYQEWPSDLEFFQKAIPNFIDQEKFASYMISVTAHTPYIFSSKMGDQYLSLFDDLDISIQAKRYLSKVKEDDLALEYLLNSLEEKGILDDTVIVLFGDHYPYGLTDKQYQSLANYDISSDREVDRTPFIIYNSETDPAIIEKYTTPLDYTPTILNLFGIDYDPRYYFGHDIFSDYTDYAVFPDNSWQNSRGFYSAPKGEFTLKEGSEGYTDEEIIAINQEISDMKNMSALAIKKNYFDYLFKKFDEYETAKKEEKSKENAERKTKKLEED